MLAELAPAWFAEVHTIVKLATATCHVIGAGVRIMVSTAQVDAVISAISV
jgi:hypothetical protein